MAIRRPLVAGDGMNYARKPLDGAKVVRCHGAQEAVGDGRDIADSLELVVIILWLTHITSISSRRGQDGDTLSASGGPCSPWC